MIKQLEIENFRCFGKSTLSGFERVNLIGGQNNSGKTAFLEALYLNCSPRAETVLKLRGISKETVLTFPERAWNGLFRDHNNQLVVNIKSTTQQGMKSESKISFGYLQDSEEESSELDEGGLEDLSANLFISYKPSQNDKASRIAAKMGSYKIIEQNEVLEQISFIAANEKAPAQYLAKQYDQSYLRGYSDKITEAFNIIDPSISEVRTLMSGDTLYLSRKNQRPMSIALFGDAMNRVAHFVLELINNQAGILLVDEIENGIHHSHQKQLWQWLFALAVELDVQIFATTHSLEMLTAFKEAAKGTQYESEVAYFKFARHVKTQEIISIKREIDSLDYSLSRNKEIRGE